MIIGIAGISLAIDGDYQSAVICLMLSGLCDMFDGAIASTKERNQLEKRFGIQIDSLCDLICFGVLPGILVYEICNDSMVAFGIACFYILCALVRLAYFNVLEEERQNYQTGKRTHYQGLPVTSVALLVPAAFVIVNKIGIGGSGVYLVMLAAAACAFVLPFRIKKPYKAGKIGIVFTGALEFIILMTEMVGDV